MKHTIISWDCSFRNFFHLIDGLLAQNCDRKEFELIYVEQRTREYADAYNHQLGLKSLWDRYEQVKDRIKLRVVYLNDLPNTPYLLSKCNNAALELAHGDIISVMDGDILLPANFMTSLTAFHERQAGVANLVRLMSKYPVGVWSFRDWTKAHFGFQQCLSAATGRNRPIPRIADNKGPLISARREFWEMIGGYDSHIVWSTSASMAGSDVNDRLELATQTESVALPDTVAVHPWHPLGYARKARQDRDQLVNEYFSIQLDLRNWSIQNKVYHWQPRVSRANTLYEANQVLVEAVIQEESLDFQTGPVTTDSLARNTIPNILEVAIKNTYDRLRYSRRSQTLSSV